MLPYFRKFLFLTTLPNFILTFISWFLNKFTSEKRLAKRISALHAKDHDGISEIYLRFNKWRDMLDQKWRTAGIDALIAPC